MDTSDLGPAAITKWDPALKGLDDLAAQRRFPVIG